MRNQLSPITRNVLARVDAQGIAVFDSLLLVRHILKELVDIAGVELVFDPSVEPDLLDALGVATFGALQGAVVGGGLGLLVGLLLGYPRHGLAVGSLLGGVAGANRGVAAVHHGVRLRVRALSLASAQYIIVEAD